jgi:DNA-binding transcriptional ArsR family regulator
VAKAKTAYPVSDAVTLDGEQFAEVAFFCGAWLAAGLTLLAGKPKMGKSWLVLCMLDAISRDVEALGSLSVKVGDVLYISLEDTKRRLQQRLRAVRQGAEPSPRFHFATAWPKLDDGGLDLLRDWLKEHPHTRVVCIDTFGRIRGKPSRRDVTLYQADYDAAVPLKALADEFGIAIMLVHHLRKATADDPLDEISGSTGLTGAADTLMVLKRDKGTADATIYVRGRDIEESETALQHDKDTGRWVVLGDAAQFRQSKERSDILMAMKAAGDPISPRELADALNKNRSTVRNLLDKLLKAGLVRKERTGKYVCL